MMIEREKTYLAISIPEEIYTQPYDDMLDIYVGDKKHPQLRIRQRGTKYEITKKQPIDNDPSTQRETTIPLTLEEFEELSTLPGRRIQKRRYCYDYQGKELEIDVFVGSLEGLILVDAEFDNAADMHVFAMPHFCQRDVTIEKRVAGGVLAGKAFSDIKQFIQG